MGWIPEPVSDGGIQAVHGQAVIENPDTDVVVTHSIDETPVVGQIQVTPYDQEAAASDFWLSTLGATTFQLNVATTPTVEATFGWLYVAATEAEPPPPAGFPVVVATNTSSQDSASTSHPVSMPGGVQSGDLLVVVFTMSGSASPTVSATGWTQIAGLSSAAGNWSVHARIADGTEGSPVTFTSSNTTDSQGSAHNSYRITGFHNTGTVTDAVEGSWPATATIDPPSLAPSWGSANTLWITVARTRTTINSLTAPTDYTDQLDAFAAGGSSVQKSKVASARRELATSTEDPDTWGSTGTLSSQRAGTFAVRPS